MKAARTRMLAVDAHCRVRRPACSSLRELSRAAVHGAGHRIARSGNRENVDLALKWIDELVMLR